VLDSVRKEIGDLYPPIPDPEVWSVPPEIAFDHQAGEWKVAKPGKPKRGVKLDDFSPTAGKQATGVRGQHRGSGQALMTAHQTRSAKGKSVSSSRISPSTVLLT